MIKTDIIIIGAGPVGLFTIFEAGLMKLKCHLIDALPQVGGQLSEIYPKKPIYDIPGFPSVLAGELVDNLMEQAKPFNPKFTLGDRAETIKKQEDGTFVVRSLSGVLHHAPVVIIAGGLGSFEPRKPQIPNIEQFEGRGLEYMVKDPMQFHGKKILISGGGDSALDWAIYFAKDYAESVTLVHRTDMFRAHKDSLEQIYKLQEKGKIKLILVLLLIIKNFLLENKEQNQQCYQKDQIPHKLKKEKILPGQGHITEKRYLLVKNRQSME